MPKVKAKVLVTKKDERGRLLAKVQFNNKLPAKDTILTVKWGSKRSKSQNAFYWKYLSWLIEDAGLMDHGHFSPHGLHESLKQHLLKGESTTLTTKSEFGEYFMVVRDFVRDFFEVDDSDFFNEYEELYSPY